MGMEEKDIRYHFSTNVSKLRKDRGWSQLELGHKLSYSDKAVSKWETGETLPDIVTLVRIAELFHISVNDLISNEEVVKESNKSKMRLHITTVSSGLAALLVVVAYFVLILLQNLEVMKLQNNILSIFYPGTIAAASTVSVVFCALWFKRRWLFISITVLIYSLALIAMFIMNFHLWWLILIIALLINCLFYIFLKIIRSN